MSCDVGEIEQHTLDVLNSKRPKLGTLSKACSLRALPNIRASPPPKTINNNSFDLK
jgi:hypothetical protein